METVSKEQYDNVVKQRNECEATISAYHKQARELFAERLKTNPIFSLEEIRFSAFNRCPCGAGLAYPLACGPTHYWECAAILTGTANAAVKHTAQLPFMFYNIKSEGETPSDPRTTRP